jgi:NAD(P)H-flavin reductase
MTVGGDDRPKAPLGTRAATVAAVERLGDYVLVDALDDCGVIPRAGQFYMLATEQGWGTTGEGRPYLPRALSFARVRGEGGALRLTFLLECVGPGTQRLAATAPGEHLRIGGPFGNGFAVDEGEAVLVGGGVGVAPVLALFEDLIAAGRDDISVLLGFRSAAHATAAELFEGAAVVATDDGSRGHHGVVTDLLEQRIAHDHATVYSCGPPPMLEAVRRLAQQHDRASQLALESGMACGYGACYGCVVPTHDGYLRICVDGPVIEGALLPSALVGGH